MIYFAKSLFWSHKLYSFIKARKKNLLQIDTKLWLIFCGLLVGFFLAVDLFISIQTHSHNERKMVFDEKKDSLEKEIEILTKSIAFIKEQESLGGYVKSNNIIIKDSIVNLFSLIPDQIHLEKTDIDRNELTMYGFTPTKNIYNELLMPPLKSIFNESSVIFYPIENGWYRFVSKNKSKEDFLYEKY